MEYLPGLAQLDAEHELSNPVNQVEQAEHQRKSDRAQARAGEENHAEGDRYQPAEDEHCPCPGGLADLERRDDLDQAAGDRPAARDQHQHERGGPRPCQSDHPGGQVDQHEQQVPDDRPRAGAGERPQGLQAGGDERVHGEHDDQRENRDPGPGQRHDPDGDREDAAQDERSTE